VIERPSDALSKPPTIAHCPNSNIAFDFTDRLAITGIPFTDCPVSTLNAASRSSVTLFTSCTVGVTFSISPKSSKVKEGVGVYAFGPWKLCGP